ncbi:RagB/SusD family nutrient uptake outer membrane protein [Parapedobacter deserti]|uniref:RagB/SusD family nutrient uptake outer membrane protein n=1 Tax=Parapedobacter deserti TaxID=1912957 RepID=A0ABV7JJU9_9SPHI
MKIIRLLYGVFLACALSGCEEMLTESPQSIIAPNDFFTTEAQCIQATNGVYSSLTGIFGNQDLWALTFAGSDLFLFNGGGVDIRAYQAYTHSASASASSYNTWNRCYTAIKNANMVIAKVAEAPIDQRIKDRLLGEAKYLRALYYFILSNVFGDVPMWLDELDVTTVSEMERTPLAAIRAQLITDLAQAEAGLPWQYGAEDLGRVTKGAALGLLAKMHLYNEDWTNAATVAKRIIEEGPYELLPYDQLFSEFNEHKNNSESLFEIQFSRNAETGQNFQVNYFYTWFFPTRDGTSNTYSGVNFGTTNLESYPEFYPTNKLIGLYEAGDLRLPFVIAYEYDEQPFTGFPRHLADPTKIFPWFGPKFWDLTALRRASEKNLYFMRFAEVLLIHAEALNELNQTDQAVLELNKIRQRSGLDDLGNLSQPEVKAYIMDERARELVGEFQRRWDLMRWDILVEVVQSTAEDNPVGAQNVKPYHRFFPIPHDEIVKNPNLTQNDGYQ